MTDEEEEEGFRDLRDSGGDEGEGGAVEGNEEVADDFESLPHNVEKDNEEDIEHFELQQLPMRGSSICER